MLGVALRRHRYDALAAAAALAGVGAVALVTGFRMSGDYHSSGLAQCLGTGPRSGCQPLIDRFGDRFAALQLLIVPLVLLPGLLGAFLGAPLVAREVEAGTHRFWWTQGVTRRGWFLSSSVVVVGLSAVLGAMYAAITARWLDVTNRVTDERFSRLYDFQGLVPIASAVFAVCVGIACGVVLRRTLPAMAATLGIFVAVRMSTALVLRPRFATAVVMSVPYSRSDPLAGTGAWQLTNRTVDATGIVLGRDGSLDLAKLGGRCPGIPATPGDRLPDPSLVDRCLRDLDVRSVIRYHPGNRFWTFQLMESSLLLVIAVFALVAATVALRRRAT